MCPNPFDPGPVRVQDLFGPVFKMIQHGALNPTGFHTIMQPLLRLRVLLLPPGERVWIDMSSRTRAAFGPWQTDIRVEGLAV